MFWYKKHICMPKEKVALKIQTEATCNAQHEPTLSQIRTHITVMILLLKYVLILLKSNIIQ